MKKQMSRIVTWAVAAVLLTGAVSLTALGWTNCYWTGQYHYDTVYYIYRCYTYGGEDFCASKRYPEYVTCKDTLISRVMHCDEGTYYEPYDEYVLCLT